MPFYISSHFLLAPPLPSSYLISTFLNIYTLTSLYLTPISLPHPPLSLSTLPPSSPPHLSLCPPLPSSYSSPPPSVFHFPSLPYPMLYYFPHPHHTYPCVPLTFMLPCSSFPPLYVSPSPPCSHFLSSPCPPTCSPFQLCTPP